MSIEKFYAELGGDNLVDPSRYPPEIRNYLSSEEQAIARTIIDYEYNYFIEVGCMDGRSLPLATSLSVPYYGIDIVDRYITLAQDKIQSIEESGLHIKAEARKLSVYHLADHLRQYPLESSGNQPVRPVVIFPFNSFGNMDDPQQAIQAVSDCNIDLLILTYQTDEHANGAREQYYKNCGYSGLVMTEDTPGIRFTSSEGLNSVAYNEAYVMGLLNQRFSVKTYSFGEIGIGYHGLLLEDK